MSELDTYELQFGRFGAYYRDLITGDELDLKTILDLLNKPKIEISAIEALIDKDGFSVEIAEYDSRWVIDVEDLKQLIKESQSRDKQRN